MPILLGVITMTDGSNASPLDEFHWKNRVLVVVAPAGNAAAETQFARVDAMPMRQDEMRRGR